MYLIPFSNSNERSNFPSASEYDRLLACRASYLLSRKAYALGQVAHEWSPAADLGTRKHLASIEGPQVLERAEREDWETVQRKREEFIKGWRGNSHEVPFVKGNLHSVKNLAAQSGVGISGNSQEPFTSTKEQRLWLRRGIRPLLTGK